MLNTGSKFDINRKPEDTTKKAEKEINRLVEESAACKNNGSFTEGL